MPASLVKAAKQQAKAEKTFISALWIKAMEHYLEQCAEVRGKLEQQDRLARFD